MPLQLEYFQRVRPYIALNSETFISLRHQELRPCKNIGFEFYFKEPFVVKHKSNYSCESAIYFNLGCKIIKEKYNFAYYFNKTDIKPAALDGRNETIFWQSGPTVSTLNAI